MSVNRKPEKPEKYVVDVSKILAYHVKLVLKQHDEAKKKYRTIEKIQVFGEKEWSVLKKEIKMLGYDDFEILHDPTENKDANLEKYAEYIASKKGNFISRKQDSEIEKLKAQIEELKAQKTSK